VSKGVKMAVWGEYALFSRMEMKVERVSYDAMTPSAARGILEAVYWKPEIRWIVDRIHVLKPIRFETVRRNELGSKASLANLKKAMKDGRSPAQLFIENDRQQRAALILRDVAYGIEAHFEIISGEENPAKHLETFKRRARKGQCFHQPCLGCREFPAHFALPENDFPPSEIEGERDLGWMLHDLDYSQDMTPRFFRAVMQDGIIEVPPSGDPEVRA